MLLNQLFTPEGILYLQKLAGETAAEDTSTYPLSRAVTHPATGAVRGGLKGGALGGLLGASLGASSAIAANQDQFLKGSDEIYSLLRKKGIKGAVIGGLGLGAAGAGLGALRNIIRKKQHERAMLGRINMGNDLSSNEQRISEALLNR